MNTNEEKLIKLIGDNSYVSLSDILNNLKVLRVATDDICIHYFITRVNKNMPWPAPYQAGQKISGVNYHCCSYKTLTDDNWPEDTKQLIVYCCEKA